MEPREVAPAHALARAHRNDRLLLAATVGALAMVVWLGVHAWAGIVALVTATATGTLAAFRPWCRRLSQRALAAATWQTARSLEVEHQSSAHDAARWQAIVDTATEGIVTIDPTGIIESVNGAARRLFGYTLDELRGRNVSVLMPEPFRSEHDGYLQRYLTTGEKRIIGIGREVTGIKKDGTEFPIDLSIGEGHTDSRRFFTAIVRDISERKEIQLKLAQTERLAAIGELAAGIAHEINNPINTVINCAQLILDGDDLAGNCKVIHEESERIADIVRDLLQFARDDRDRAQPTSLPEVVARTLRLLGENWKRHGITVHVDMPEDLPLARGRPQQLQQVLLNLLINAKDALLGAEIAARKVWLSAQPQANGVELTVRDNGPGIPPLLGTKIFEPFVTTKRARGGTGLGLSISKGIVESFGGTIDVDSEPGNGATFRVWLPLAAIE